ncbi:MAG: alpha/beta hydrolase, partial [Chloroflexota bacterium]|nr:alpha/beta hydrolase [Chloroflexota bacterium]
LSPLSAHGGGILLGTRGYERATPPHHHPSRDVSPCRVPARVRPILAAEYAARYPAHVRGLVLISLPSYQSKAEAQAYIIEHGEWMARITVLNGGAAHSIHLLLATFRPLVTLLAGRLSHAIPAAVAEDSLAHTWHSYSGTLAHCVLSHNVLPALIALGALPILALHGNADPAAPLAAVQSLAAQVPTMTLHILPGKHHIFLTQHAACLAAIQSALTAMQSNAAGA